MVRKSVRRGLHAFGLELVDYPAPPSLVRADFQAGDVAIIEAAAPYSMTSPERLFAVIEATRHLVRHDVPGTIVECGVWKGGSMIAVARTLKELGIADRHLYLFDTFDGMTAPGPCDTTFDGQHASGIFEEVRCRSSLADVQRAVLEVGYPERLIHFVEGRVEDTLPANAPDQIALLRLDTDWYDSTRHELQHLYPRLSDGGVLIIDDYGHWQGARTATDEYFRQHDIRMLLNRIDYTGRIGVKSPASAAMESRTHAVPPVAIAR